MQGEEYTATARAIRDGDLDRATLPRPERMLLDFIGTLTRHAYRITDRQVQGLRDVGWTDPQIAEAVYVGALFNLFVRLADAFDIHPPALYDSDGGVPSVVMQDEAAGSGRLAAPDRLGCPAPTAFAGAPKAGGFRAARDP